jgi:hypothetical protein
MRDAMDRQRKYYRIISSESGFALVAAIIACLILMALAMLVISLSTGDLKTSTTVVGDKISMSAVESGIHNLTQTFDPAATNYGIGSSWQSVTSGSSSQFKYTASATSAIAPLPLAGYSMEAGQGWGMARYNISVEGQDTSYSSKAQVDVGVGYGPVPISTIYK